MDNNAREKDGNSHEEAIDKWGFDICTPISGSMRPMLRPRKDSVLFVRPRGKLKCYDVVLYRRGAQAIMHRIICVNEDGYEIRGDNSGETELVKEENIIGVMQGFYRGEKYILSENWLYRCYSRVWVVLHPLLMLYKKKRRCGQKKWGRRTT